MAENTSLFLAVWFGIAVVVLLKALEVTVSFWFRRTPADDMRDFLAGFEQARAAQELRQRERYAIKASFRGRAK